MFISKKNVTGISSVDARQVFYILLCWPEFVEGFKCSGIVFGIEDKRLLRKDEEKSKLPLLYFLSFLFFMQCENAKNMNFGSLNLFI